METEPIMQDTIFNVVLFIGFYCLYAAMFAPKTQPVSVAVPQPVAPSEPATETTTATTTAPAIVVTTEVPPVSVNVPAPVDHTIEPIAIEATTTATVAHRPAPDTAPGIPDHEVNPIPIDRK